MTSLAFEDDANMIATRRPDSIDRAMEENRSATDAKRFILFIINYAAESNMQIFLGDGMLCDAR